MRPTKPFGTNQVQWDEALNKTELMGNWLDYIIGWIPICRRWLWGTRAYAYYCGRFLPGDE